MVFRLFESGELKVLVVSCRLPGISYLRTTSNWQLTTNMKVHIIGGGIIGWSTAWYLNEAGFEVSIIEKEQKFEGCSHGNSGIIVPSHFVPLAAPGVITKGIKWMFDAKSPFYIKPRLNLELLQWLWQFYRSCSEKKAREAMPVLLEFNQLSKSLYEDLNQQPGFDFQLEKKGLMMLFKTKKAKEEEEHIVSAAADLGLHAAMLTAAEVRQHHPGLEVDVLGGSYFPSDAHVNPNLFMKQIRKVGEKKGITSFSNTAVTGFKTEKGQIRALATADGQLIPTDQVVLAAGGWTARLARQLGIRLLLQGGKGYSITVDRKDKKPAMPVIFTEAKVALTPLKNQLRIAGTLEIGGLNNKIHLKRMEGILESVPRYFPEIDCEMPPKEQIWHGFRPCTPDGLPFIGKHPKYQNMILATGHAMMGMSTGPATGLLVTEMMQGKKTSMGVELFDPVRR
jgi:D-amino-acid dehydrogenase